MNINTFAMSVIAWQRIGKCCLLVVVFLLCLFGLYYYFRVVAVAATEVWYLVSVSVLCSPLFSKLSLLYRTCRMLREVTQCSCTIVTVRLKEWPPV